MVANSDSLIRRKRFRGVALLAAVVPMALLAACADETPAPQPAPVVVAPAAPPPPPPAAVPPARG